MSKVDNKGGNSKEYQIQRLKRDAFALSRFLPSFTMFHRFPWHGSTRYGMVG